ncbi:hypothetical protein B0H16DRAFT_1728145 [Mycena metata]|uniref:Uncharacterized protein n=1 Tax=Mycena metata TaxID=1033252 RepID=A0AAD7N1R3_9AGAR|nr:hypothetical protein B0H16DRAFT_1728145 [Mycena metata]
MLRAVALKGCFSHTVACVYACIPVSIRCVVSWRRALICICVVFTAATTPVPVRAHRATAVADTAVSFPPPQTITIPHRHPPAPKPCLFPLHRTLPTNRAALKTGTIGASTCTHCRCKRFLAGMLMQQGRPWPMLQPCMDLDLGQASLVRILNTVGAVFGGTPPPLHPPMPLRQERTTAAPVSPPTDSTRSHVMALLRRTAHPLSAVGSPAPTLPKRRWVETSAAAPSTGTNNHLHYPQPQNPANIDHYLRAPPRRREEQ